MNFQFATCERRRALGFLQKLYPSYEITDTPESAGPMLDMVERDVFRIPDPMMHGGHVAVYPSKNWTDEMRPVAMEALKTLESSPLKSQEQEVEA